MSALDLNVMKEALPAEDSFEKLVLTLKGVIAPSEFAKSRAWQHVDPTWKGTRLLETHRHPASAVGYLHVSLTDETLAEIYELHQKGIDLALKAEDCKFTREIAELACATYEKEDDRKPKMRKPMLNYLGPANADKQDSSTSSRSTQKEGEIKTDGGLKRRDEPQYYFLHIEFKNELGQSGDPVMELVCYTIKFATEDASWLKTSTLPTILIAVSGPHVVVICAAWTGKCFQFDYLDSITLFKTCHMPEMERQAKFWKQLKLDLEKLASAPAKLRQAGFPYRCEFKDAETNEKVTLKYTEEIKNHPGVFEATDGKVKI
jgi:hypothetical protein